MILMICLSRFSDEHTSHISDKIRVCGCKRFEICSVEIRLLKIIFTVQNHIHIGWKKLRGLNESSYLPLCLWLYLNFTDRKHVHILHVVKQHFWVHVLGNHKQSLCSKCPLSISTVIENARVALQITNRKKRTLKPII